jgi:hypothetical protein
MRRYITVDVIDEDGYQFRGAILVGSQEFEKLIKQLADL